MVATHKFKSTEDAYVQSQYRDGIKSGDASLFIFRPDLSVRQESWFELASLSRNQRINTRHLG